MSQQLTDNPAFRALLKKADDNVEKRLSPANPTAEVEIIITYRTDVKTRNH